MTGKEAIIHYLGMHKKLLCTGRCRGKQAQP